MATPQFNIKTGADSSAYFSREVTQTDVSGANSPFTADQLGLIKKSDTNGNDLYNYPVLVRRTGNSIKGSTESIESNELRKGRTKSAPRKGNSSSEGSLDFEFSPETYDDILEAALRNTWKPWTGDKDSATNLDKISYPVGEFATKIGDTTGATVNPSKKLVGKLPIDNALVTTDQDVEIHELTCGTKDVKYSLLSQFGGEDDGDLFQEFQHLAVNTASLSVTPGQIVTGSFGFMGLNNPSMFQKGDADSGMVKALKGRFVTDLDADGISKWIDGLPAKGTSTDQYTAREGFLYVNGDRVQYGSNLSFELNNGLEKTFAIFEKDSIATSPLKLDITGSLGAYLIKGHSEKLYNLGTQDKDVELVFCFQDKEENPESLYVVQIFKSKFTSQDLSSGAENLEVTFPFQSFEERACRILRIRKRKPIATTFENDTGKINVELSSVPEVEPVAADFTVVLKVDGVDETVTFDKWDADTKTATFAFTTVTAGDTDKGVDLSVTYNGKDLTNSYVIAKA